MSLLVETDVTTGIGIRCKDGIVLASDSQGSYKKGIEMKRFGVSKIFNIRTGEKSNIAVALIGAGNSRHVKRLVEELEIELNNRIVGERDLRDFIENAMLRLHKKYNVDRSRLLGSKSTELYFQPNSLLGVSITTGTEKTFELYHLHADPWVEPIEDYETVGSGAPFADLLMKQLVRQVEVAGDTWKDVTVDVAIKFVSYYMNEIKTTDIGSGGSTRVSLLDQNGLHDLTNDEISKHHQEFIERLTKGLSQIPEEAIKKVFSQT